jgi:hypothetical protein
VLRAEGAHVVGKDPAKLRCRFAHGAGGVVLADRDVVGAPTLDRQTLSSTSGKP